MLPIAKWNSLPLNEKELRYQCKWYGTLFSAMLQTAALSAFALLPLASPQCLRIRSKGNGSKVGFPSHGFLWPQRKSAPWHVNGSSCAPSHHYPQGSPEPSTNLRTLKSSSRWTIANSQYIIIKYTFIFSAGGTTSQKIWSSSTCVNIVTFQCREWCGCFTTRVQRNACLLVCLSSRSMLLSFSARRGTKKCSIAVMGRLPCTCC